MKIRITFIIVEERNKLSKIATTATAISFSIFTKMMCQYFGTLKFLESTLKLLQQFKN